MSLCVVGNPSSRKSNAAAFGPNIIKRASAKILKERKAEIDQRRAELRVVTVQIKTEQKSMEKSIEAGEKPNGIELDNLLGKAKELRRGVIKNYIVNNATIQGLQLLMSQRPGGYIQQFDELTGWLEFLESKMQAGGRGEFLELMNQGVENYQVTRKGEGLSLVIDHAHVSLIGTLQTDMFELFKAKKDGLIQRLNVINPNFRQPLRRENHHQDAWVEKVVTDFMTYCIEANVDEYSNEGGLYFCEAAEKQLVDIEEAIRGTAAQSNTELQSYLNKAMTMVYNLACVYHAWENFCEHRKDKIISLQATVMAANAMQVFVAYAVTQYIEKVVDDEGAESIETKMWTRLLTDFVGRPITVRLLRRTFKLLSVADVERFLAKKCSDGGLKLTGKNRANKPIYSIE